MPTYTVVALLDLDTQPPDMLVAGVLDGEHDMRDSHSQSGSFQRFATSVEAESAAEAERIATNDFYDSSDEEDEE